MDKRFPKKLHVKIEPDDEAPYFIADRDLESLAELGEKTTVATYKLVKVRAVVAVVKSMKAKR